MLLYFTVFFLAPHTVKTTRIYLILIFCVIWSTFYKNKTLQKTFTWKNCTNKHKIKQILLVAFIVQMRQSRNTITLFYSVLYYSLH